MSRPSVPGGSPNAGSQRGAQLAGSARTSLPALARRDDVDVAAIALATRPPGSVPSLATAITSTCTASSGTSASTAKLPSAAVSARPPALVTTTAPGAGEPFGRQTRPVNT